MLHLPASGVTEIITLMQPVQSEDRLTLAKI